MKKYFIGLFSAAIVALGSAPGWTQTPVQPFSLPDTQVMPFSSKDGSHTFRLLIGLPRNYAARTTERFPVIYLLDADFSFALTQDIQRHTTDRGQEKEAIVVGVAYPGADTDIKIYERTRTQDYTPTNTPDGGYSPDMQALSGGGPKFLDILRRELLPFIDSSFRTIPTDRTIVGHSYGALLGSYAMLERPGLFQNYLMVSPSLWYDNEMILRAERAYVAHHRTLPANVFYAVGSLEANSQHPMVDELRAWHDTLEAAKLNGYRSTMIVFDGDTHESVFPGALTRGLRVLDDFAGEAGGNMLEKH